MHERSGSDGGRWLAWLFVAFAVGDLVYNIVTAKFDPNPAIGDYASYTLQVIPSVASVLLPAALLFRHPDATVRARTLLVGTILFALAQGLQILTSPLEIFFEAASPASPDLPTVIPMAELYNGFISVVLAVALLSIAAGLTRARREAERSGLFTALFVPFIAVLGTVLNVLATSASGIEGISLSLGLVLFVGSAVLLPVIRMIVWSYLLIALVRGWMADERPRPGWRLATVGVGMVVVGLLLFNFNGVLPALTGTAATIYAYATVIAYALGHLSLVGAFLLGLPWLDDEQDIEDPGAGR